MRALLPFVFAVGCVTGGAAAEPADEPPEVADDAATREESAIDAAADTSPLFGSEDAGETCTAVTCNGRGTCDDASGRAVCTCDDGYAGATCAARAPDHYARLPVVAGMADPDVFKVSDDRFYLSGTTDGRTLPIYVSSDLATWKLEKTYDPAATDGYVYCDVWAPGFAKDHLYFSARRAPKGSPCPPAGSDVATFRASADLDTLEIGAPQPIHPGTSLPRTVTGAACPAEGCNRAIRIDAHVFEDWLFYVYFDGGNNIASFRFGAPGSVIDNAGPRRFVLSAKEERINEGPFVFERAGKYYLFFSGAWFDSQYAMYYVMADSVADLTRARFVHEHSRAIRDGAGRLVDSAGHNAIVERKGEYFNFFHVGAFDAAGKMTGRSTFRQRMAFRPDGTIHSLNMVDVRWSALPGHQYSLDVVTRSGEVIGPCIASGVLGSSTRATYTGICPSGGNAVVLKHDIASFRLYYSSDGVWTKHVEVPYDGVTDDVSIEIPGGAATAVDLRWNERTTGSTYSLDVQRGSGAWIGPCVGDVVIGKSPRYRFDGDCSTAGVNVPLSDVQRIRVCSAKGDWSKASCGEVAYDGALAATVAIP